MSKQSILPLLIAAIAGLAAGANAAPAQDPKTADFIKAAVQGDASEIMLGKMAAQNPSASSGVKRYGQMLVDDHSAHLQKAQALATAHGLKVSADPTMGADAESAKLHVLSGASFDKEFAQYMSNDHKTDIGDYQAEADRHDGDVSKFAASTLPTLRKHLDAALKLQKP